MTTTKTRPKTSTDELAALEAAAQGADGDVQALAQRARQAEQAVNAIIEERLQRQVTHPGEFGDDGVKSNTVAAEITERLAEARKQHEQGDWQARSQAAAERARLAHDQVIRFRAEHARELIAALEPRARQAVADFAEQATPLRELLTAIINLSTEAGAIARSANLEPRFIDFNHISQLVNGLSEDGPPWPIPRLRED